MDLDSLSCTQTLLGKLNPDLSKHTTICRVLRSGGLNHINLCVLHVHP
jgi:hypothetical protein